MAVLLAVAATLVAGCWNYKEVNDLALVTTAALDRTERGAYRWTAAIPIAERVLPASIGGATGGGEPRTSLIRTGEGPSPQVAADALELAVEREVRWSFADHLLVGEDAARHGLLPLLEMISRRYQIERRTALYLTRGPAGALLAQFQPSLDRSYARAFDELGRMTRPGTLRPVDANTVMRWLNTPGLDPFLPVVTVLRAGENQGNVVPAGIGLFQADRLVTFLEPPLDRALLVLRGESPPFPLVLSCLEGSDHRSPGLVTLRVQRTSSQVRTDAPSGQPKARVSVRLTAVMTEWECLQPMDLVTVGALQREANRRLHEEIHRALEVFRRHGVDPVGFGAALHRSDPAAWRGVARRWRQELRRLPVEVTVQLTVRSYQLTGERPSL